MELSIARLGAMLGPLAAGALQQIYQSPTPMFVSIGLSAIAAGATILWAHRPAIEAAGDTAVPGLPDAVIDKLTA